MALAAMGMLLSAPPVGSGPDYSGQPRFRGAEALKAPCRYVTPSFGIPRETRMFTSFVGNQLLAN